MPARESYLECPARRAHSVLREVLRGLLRVVLHPRGASLAASMPVSMAHRSRRVRRVLPARCRGSTHCRRRLVLRALLERYHLFRDGRPCRRVEWC
jgi:hypothetical protein